jgi:lipoprotein-releasing system permease protein
MSFELFVAKKYFRAKRRTGFISIITYVSIAGVTIGVTALILVLSVMNGFEEEVRSKLIGADAHIRLRRYFNKPITEKDRVLEIVQATKRVTGATPTIFEEGMIRSKQAQRPTYIKAVDLITIESVLDLKNKIEYGTFNFDEKEINGKKMPGIILGKYLSDHLMAYSEKDIVTLIIPPSQESSIFAQPRVKQFYVAGIIDLGYYEYDRIFSYISLEQAQNFFGMHDAISWIEIKIDDYEKADEVAEDLTENLGYPYTTLTWFEMNKSLFSWMQIEKWGAFVILSLIIMVAAFNIISSLIMVVMEKTREIGILKSMGATSKSIMKIFVYEGLIIGILGTLLGSILGYGVGFAQLKYKLISLPADVYIISALPIKLQVFDFLIISVIGIILCLLASIYPAFKASKLYPVDAIRYE